jgi:hypothetical protein
MRVIHTVRRLSGPAAGLLAAAAICIACSSTTSGAPASTGGGGVSSGTLPVSPSISVPGLSNLPSLTGIPSISGVPSIGGSDAGSAFCKDFNGGDLSNLGSTSDPSQAVSLWDKLTADAPDEIKGDVQAVDSYLHDAVSGNVTAVDTQKLSTAAEHIGTYYAGHCVSS